MPPYNTIDIIIIALLAIGTVRGVLRGLSGELAGLIALVIAVVIGYHFHPPFGEYLSVSTSMTNAQADTVALLVIFLGSLLAMWAIRMVLKSIMELTFKGPVERIGGGLAGFLRIGFLVALMILLVEVFGQGAVRRHVIENSWIGERASEHLVPLYMQLVERYPELPPVQDYDTDYEPIRYDSDPHD